MKERFPFDVHVLCFNRPEYLEKCLISLSKQTMSIDPSRIFFWQDGFKGSKDDYLNLPDRTQESLKLIQKYFPNSAISVSSENLGIGLTYQAAEKNAFINRSNKWGIFIEEDSVVKDFYLEVINDLINQAKPFKEIVQLDAFGDFNNQMEADFCIPSHSWAFALKFEHYVERLEIIEGYEKILAESSYWKRNDELIYSYFSNLGISLLGTSQDHVKRALIQFYKKISLTTSFSCAEYIGIEGENFNSSTFRNFGYYNQKILSVKPSVPTLSIFNVTELIWNQFCYLNSAFNLKFSAIVNERDAIVNERDALVNSRIWRWGRFLRLLVWRIKIIFGSSS